MKYRSYFGKDISQLGFGAMRLPGGGSPGSIDIAKSEELLMYAYEHGVNYYDSAYVYNNGKSEEAVGEIFRRSNVRSKIYLATKLPTFGKFIDGDFNEYFGEQLKRLQTDYIDFYLIHNLNSEKWDELKKRNIFKFMEDLKSRGVIRHIGFSFHDSCEAFKYIIDDYDWEFAQIQYNFMDTQYQAGTEGLEYAGSKNIPVVIMEPLKGGQLTGSSDPYIKTLLDSHGLSGATLAGTALKFVMDRPEVMTTLSGMNDLEHVKENIQTASEAGAGSQPENEKAFLKAFSEYVSGKDIIPCTACRYCTADCPEEISIPDIFTCYNDAVMFDSTEANRRSVGMFHSNIRNCAECGQCSDVCPQHFDIPELLKKVRTYLGTD